MVAGDAVDLPPPWGRERQAREVGLCAAVAAAAAALAVLAVPRGGDLAAHVYRADLVRHGILVWDNLWFAGQYPLASYSLLYYLLAASVGNTALGIGGVVVSAAIFASVAQREWRSLGRWPARIFALLLAGQAFTGAYPFLLGVGALLATLWALQRQRLRLAAACTVLTLGFSPLAFLFLALALVAMFVYQRSLTRRTVVIGAVVAATGALQIGVLVVFPSPGLFYPFGTWRFLLGLAVAGLGLALALQRRRGWSLATMFAVWALASVFAEFVPSPVGHNILRASIFVVPLVLVAAAVADFRPRWLTATALAAALAAVVVPYATMVSDRSTDRDSRAVFWQPVLAFLHRHSNADFRIEVVPTANHWEAYYFPSAGFALARGWYRQLDIADNPALYRRTLTGADYQSWLRLEAVRYVVVPHLPGEITAPHEAWLVRSGRAGLKEVWNGVDATVYELPHATPLLTGAAAAAVTRVGPARIAGWVGRPGRYVLRSRYSPYLRLGQNEGCLAPAGNATTSLDLHRAGRFTITAIESPGTAISMLLDSDRPRCTGFPSR